MKCMSSYGTVVRQPLHSILFASSLVKILLWQSLILKVKS